MTTEHEGLAEKIARMLDSIEATSGGGALLGACALADVVRNNRETILTSLSSQGSTPEGDGERVARLIEAARDLVDGASRTYKARNGRTMSIEADDGEACDIVHSDLTFGLRSALEALSAMSQGLVQQNQGVAFGPGCQPSASAPDGSSQSGIPNASDVALIDGGYVHCAGHVGTFIARAMRERGIWREGDDNMLVIERLRDMNSLACAAIEGMHDFVAQTIEARSDETRSGSARQGESVVGEADAPKGE